MAPGSRFVVQNRALAGGDRSFSAENGLPPLSTTMMGKGGLDDSWTTPSSNGTSSRPVSVDPFAITTGGGRRRGYGLPRSESSTSMVSPAGSSAGDSSQGYKVREAKDPFREFLQERTQQRKSDNLILEDSQASGCKRDLRRKANLAKLEASEDLRQWMSEKPFAWRGSRQLPQTPLPLKKELKRLKQSIHRSHDSLCRVNPTGAADFLDHEENKGIEFSPAFKAKIKKAASRESLGSGASADIFATEEGQRFVQSFRRLWDDYAVESTASAKN
eukprot:CAMPEP_0197627078 /NCGR_PEP_ID=MMETSP1338-20131121/5788_1 /TAXON_ID=43686 ORGANISM="Pelagodinium beii, Strain RCC1491" /NCGR_SAMPLE_ID=MMETSP1338 /ASSEMBLY_ACC=CAM_ASM_000754 /LENGTH=273 /DNA_ID=CAMNT_0043197697 /DNA_START=56 /DNA_END=877 /DNA_ORIENTATION=+